MQRGFLVSFSKVQIFEVHTSSDDRDPLKTPWCLHIVSQRAVHSHDKACAPISFFEQTLRFVSSTLSTFVPSGRTKICFGLRMIPRVLVPLYFSLRRRQSRFCHLNYCPDNFQFILFFYFHQRIYAGHSIVYPIIISCFYPYILSSACWLTLAYGALAFSLLKLTNKTTMRHMHC